MYDFVSENLYWLLFLLFNSQGSVFVFNLASNVLVVVMNIPYETQKNEAI